MPEFLFYFLLISFEEDGSMTNDYRTYKHVVLMNPVCSHQKDFN